MDQEKLKSIIESILFISGEPVKISKISKLTGAAKPEIENAIMVLQGEFGKNRGMVIIKKDDEVQMATSPENSSFIGDLVKSEIQESLSRAALEVLSIIAYRGPISRSDVEAIRGVNSSFTMRSLLMRGLVERIDSPKDSRAYLYRISFEFLKKLGLDSAEKLPDWEALSKDDRVDSIIGN
ncbi:MAG TPA: SMC-Scp complex subunit ScpB [Candidatus Moranbacteria bacterium]|nr:SMC-Scp complex subunit ScpB [Candidatus Moranbacteria bacterium]